MDDAHFPLVSTEYPSAMTLGALEPYFADYERVLARARPFVSLVDMRPCLEMPDAIVRKHIADWGVRIAAERAKYVLGVAFVVTRPLMRAALTAVHFVAPPRQPTVVVATTDDGIAYLYEKLDAHGIARPSADTRRDTPQG